ncbi:hypothetical protein AB395_00001460 [Sinorhizobium fredii CCBAU 45436]|nr:hypothetical protein AB395_00001460 [Sinorhizobium fredii CCBAU 45436]AWM24927.1 hypothetical protein AOX55_00001668 [Sinorhizobium fredii CCBAU 25509]
MKRVVHGTDLSAPLSDRQERIRTKRHDYILCICLLLVLK